MTKSTEQKLPKQWRHWCKKAGLQIKGSRGNWCPFYMTGHGRVWRLNCLEMFQCGDTLEDFDRWALCDIEETTRPETEQEFLNAVESLLNLKRITVLEEFVKILIKSVER